MKHSAHLPQRYGSPGESESPPGELLPTVMLPPSAVAVVNSEGGAMAKHNIEVMPCNGSSYFVDVAAAKQIVARGDGKWDGPVRVIRTEDNSKRGEWVKIQSGRCGPLVLQLR